MIALVLVSAIGAAVGSAPPVVADPPRGAGVLCYLWANNAASALGTPYSPQSTYSYNFVNRDQANTVTRKAKGAYEVVCQGVGGGALVSAAPDDGAVPEMAEANAWGSGGHVQVTAYGEGSNYCKILEWATGGVNLSAKVRCFNHKGQPANAQFDFLFTW
jgi:hypothetical protein